MDEVIYAPFPDFNSWAHTFDPTAVEAAEALLLEMKTSTAEEALRRAVTVATRYAAVDTGAIEGLYSTNRQFTKTIATQTAAWEAALRQRGDQVERSISDALAGYEMVLDLVTGRRPLSESWVRQLHEVICRSQETYDVLTEVGWQKQALPTGRYKSMPNNPTSNDTGRLHHYTPVLDTPAEMRRLLAQLRSPTFSQAHPVVQAAYVHYGFVAIHPFPDGNGRVARALASVYLYRRPGVPLVVFADQKDTYLDALEAADRGMADPLVSFIEQRVIDAIELVRDQLKGPALSGDAVARLSALVAAGSGLQHHELDAVARKVAAAAQAELGKQLAAASWPAGTTRRTESGVSTRPPPGYRYLGGHTSAGVRATVTYSGSASASASTDLAVWPARRDDGAAFDLVLTGSADPGHAELHIRDVHPLETEIARIKIDAWAQRQVEALASTLCEQVSQGLNTNGYSQ